MCGKKQNEFKEETVRKREGGMMGASKEAEECARKQDGRGRGIEKHIEALEKGSMVLHIYVCVCTSHSIKQMARESQGKTSIAKQGDRGLGQSESNGEEIWMVWRTK